MHKEIFIKIDPKTKMVNYRHNFPFHSEYGLHMTREQLEAIGYFVNSDDIPSKPTVEGSYSLHYDPLTKNFYYLKVALGEEPITMSKALEIVGREATESKLINMEKDNVISKLGREIANLKIRVIQLEGGM